VKNFKSFKLLFPYPALHFMVSTQTLVRTGKAGRAGLTLLLIPKTEAVGVTRMELGLDGQETTAYVTFDDVVVPVSHRIGEEGQGFLYTVANFNHERLLVAFQALSLCRVCLRETIIWAEKRAAFGRKLIEQPVVRSKLANLGRTVESLQAWTEQITYEMEVAKVSGETKTLGGVSALLKVTSGRTVKYVADECQKIFGGAGMTKTGQGRLVEAITRRAPLLIIPGLQSFIFFLKFPYLLTTLVTGGAEDVMLDLGAREALKLSHL
jgi:alkylation response protein AidB-like acyl-CoA dehydrogenase